MFDKATRDQIARLATGAGLGAAVLLAVVEVESAVRTHAMVEGRAEPLIRFEGHYFDRRLSGVAREKARASGLADPKAGAVANPASQAARWEMLRRASAIDRVAALESVSWGLGQVMGAHWQMLGYPSVDALVEEARSGTEGQCRLMLRYIERAGLTAALRRRDWEAFERGYNGPAFRRHGYDRKLATAYARHARHASEAAGAAPGTGVRLLRRGTSGPDVGDLQTVLAALGYPLRCDGVFGRATADAVRRFQSDKRLAADGVVGPATRAALEQSIGGRRPGFLRRMLARLQAWWQAP